MAAREWEPHMDEQDRRSVGKRQGGGRGMIRFLWGVIALLLVVGVGLGVSFFTGAISTAQPTATAAPTPVPTPKPRPPVAAGQQGTGAATTGATGAADAGDAKPAKPIVTKTATYGDWIYTCL